MRVLSLGAGVQSSTLLLMACHGEIERPDLAVFADTGWEPAAVYRHLDWLTTRAAEAGIPVERVTAGNLRADSLGETKGRSQIPLHVVGPSGSHGLLNRQCTRAYKIVPIQRRVRSLGATARNPVEQWIGISLDEAIRMKPSRVKYAVHRWPLIDMRMTRLDCLNWLERHGYPRPPKSSCIGCPYHDDAYWHDLMVNSPREFADAVAYDERIRGLMRTNRRANGDVYLHRRLIPLSQVDLSTPQERGQLDMFDAECEGMCGL